MPFLPTHGRFPGALASGLCLALTLAIGCTPAPGGGRGPMATPTPRATPPQPTVGPTAAPSPAPTSSTSQTSVSFSTQVAPLLQARCAACHTGAGVGGVSLFESGGAARHGAISSRISDIIAQVATGAMPRGGPRLTQSEVGLLQTWRDNGTPNN